MREITIQPLTREAFRPFGDVIEIEGAHSFPINHGMCVRYHDLAKVEPFGQIAVMQGNVHVAASRKRFMSGKGIS